MEHQNDCEDNLETQKLPDLSLNDKLGEENIAGARSFLYFPGYNSGVVVAS